MEDEGSVSKALSSQPLCKITTFPKNKPSGFSKASDIKPFIPKPEELISAIALA